MTRHPEGNEGPPSFTERRFELPELFFSDGSQVVTVLLVPIADIDTMQVNGVEEVFVTDLVGD